MYNNIGLPTPRGSGTSGFVQVNLSHMKWKLQNRDDFLKELKKMHEVPIAPARKANPEIIEHEKKRQIQVKLLEMRVRLEDENVPEEDIEKKLSLAEAILQKEYEEGHFDIGIDEASTHQKAQAKHQEMNRMAEAFQVERTYKSGSAFDFDGQEKDRLQKQFEKESKKVKELEEIRQDMAKEREKEKELRKLEKRMEKEKKKAIKKAIKRGKKDSSSSDDDSEEENKKKHKKESGRKEKEQKQEKSNKHKDESRHKQQKESDDRHKQKDREGRKTQQDVKINKKRKSSSSDSNSSNSRSRSRHRRR